MERRMFLRKGILAGSLFSLNPSSLLFGSTALKSQETGFNLDYAPHLGMFQQHAGPDPVDQLEFMAQSGFTAFEDNEMRKRSIAEQERMALAMRRLGIRMGVFVAHDIFWKEPNLASGEPKWRSAFLEDIQASVEVAKRLGARWMTVVPGHIDPKLDMHFQMTNVAESLKQASAILEPHGLVMVLEPLNFRDHPGMFLTQSPQAYQLCKAVNSPSCKILFDVYHQQIQEGNLIPNILACWDEIAYFQVGDNPGRNEPTTGEINYRNLFKLLYEKGYKGIIGMEHGNSAPDKEGEQAVISAYREVDDFL